MKKWMLGGVIAAVAAVSMSIGALAATNLEEINAYLNKGVSIKLKGNVWTPKDEEGNIQYPITYNGSTYLPIRAVSEAVGMNVGWDQETQTVLLGEEETAAAIEAKGSTATITKAEFDQLESGMTYDEVKHILGGDGELRSEMGKNGTDEHSATYVWFGAAGGGSNAVLSFQGGKLLVKAQAGLE